MSGTIKIDGSGNVELNEADGIDYAAVTVQLPGGERVPFLFTVKNLQVRVSAACFCREHSTRMGMYGVTRPAVLGHSRIPARPGWLPRQLWATDHTCAALPAPCASFHTHN
jgi:hypothetical protein